MRDDTKFSHKRPGMGHGPGRGPMAVGEKPRDFKGSAVKLILFLKPYLPAIIIALVLAVAGTVFNIIGPKKISEITGIITAGLEAAHLEGILDAIDLQAVTRIGILLVVLYGLGALFSYTQGFIMCTITQRVSNRMRRDISRKINRLPLKYFDSHSYGDVLSRVTNDVDTLGQTMNQSIGTLVTSVTMFFGVLIMMLSINFVMTLTAVLSTLLGFTLMILIVTRSQKYFRRQQGALGAIDGHIEEIYSGHNVVTVYNGEEAAKQEFDRINRELCDSAWKSQFMSGMMPSLMNFIGNLGYVAVCVVGSVMAMHGSIRFDVIVAFMLYVRLFSNPLSQMAQVITNLQSAVAASERVFDFLAEEELSDESHKTRKLEIVSGDVKFDHVKFGYTPQRIIIHDFSADIHAGQKVAIVGPTGAGKTTLVNLLMRFYELDGGQILVDNVPISELTRENVHGLFGMVLQDTWLFEGTIRENIVYGKPGVNDEDIRRACKAVGIDHFVRTLPQGYDTVLNDKANLSQGQKQLLTIARAMIENAPLLILDEATSSVDTRTEAQIQIAMDRLTEGRTSFVIAHRLSTIKNANLILVMKDGDIIESGTHEELLQKGGFYRDLYMSQFENAA